MSSMHSLLLRYTHQLLQGIDHVCVCIPKHKPYNITRKTYHDEGQCTTQYFLHAIMHNEWISDRHEFVKLMCRGHVHIFTLSPDRRKIHFDAFYLCLLIEIGVNLPSSNIPEKYTEQWQRGFTNQRNGTFLYFYYPHLRPGHSSPKPSQLQLHSISLTNWILRCL